MCAYEKKKIAHAVEKQTVFHSRADRAAIPTQRQPFYRPITFIRQTRARARTHTTVNVYTYICVRACVYYIP